MLESVAHAGENLLDALREREITLDKSLITTLLEMNDAIGALLATIQESGTDTSGGDFSPLDAIGVRRNAAGVDPGCARGIAFCGADS